MEPQLDPDYQRSLDEAVSHHLDLYDARSYDLVGRRIDFQGYDVPLDVLVVDLDSSKVIAEYILDGGPESFRREIAAEKFLDGFDGDEWSFMALESSKRFNTNVSSRELKGSLYHEGRADEIDEFLLRYAGNPISAYDELEVVE